MHGENLKLISSVQFVTAAYWMTRQQIIHTRN